MTGVCSACGKEQRVPSHRGSRIADYRCRECGGELHGKTKGRAGVSRKKVSCVVCGATRMEPSWRVKRPEQPFELDAYSRTAAEMRNEPLGPFPADSPVCWFHDIRSVEAVPA